MVVVALLSVDLVESVDLVSVVLVVNCIGVVGKWVSFSVKSRGRGRINKGRLPKNPRVIA